MALVVRYKQYVRLYMANRPFFKTGIAELEQMFEQGSSDPSFRKLLREELEYRTTQRADRLKKTPGGCGRGWAQYLRPLGWFCFSAKAS